MVIFQIAQNKFAIGKPGKRAAYVVATARGKVTGVRGQRPLLNDRYRKAKPSKAVVEALKAAVA